MDADIYTRLRERIDGYSVGMNPSGKGIELEILKRLFSVEEAEVYLAMNRSLEPVRAIASRAGLAEAEAARILGRMADKGLVFPRTSRGRRYYAAAPFMHGFFEHQVYRKDPDPVLERLVEDYLRGGFIPKTRSLRTIPIKTDMPDSKRVLPYDDVREIIASKERIGLFTCACSHHMKALGSTACDHAAEVCIAFDFYAEYPIEEAGFGRWITHSEALSVLDYAEEKGLVHQAGGDARNVECICNCCSDCCTILRFLKLLPNPGMYLSSNYAPSYDPARCALCGACVEICPMDALFLSEDRVEASPERCIGCGVCARACTHLARSVVMKPASNIRKPPSPQKYTFMRSSLDYWADLESTPTD